MDNIDYEAFKSLYKAAYEKCFAYAIVRAMSESESKLFSNQLLESTGLAVGWRSLKNYSVYVLNSSYSKSENPLLATLDTLARYVLEASYTSEISRKDNESHYPYWFQYREQFIRSIDTVRSPGDHVKSVTFFYRFRLAIFISLILLSGVIIYIWITFSNPADFIDDFLKNDESALKHRGWQIIDKDSIYWAKRELTADYLTLFTLPGDNWPDSIGTKPRIRNLLLRRLPFECFAADIQLSDFTPNDEWQQAGILLLKDSSLNSPSIRMTLAFNDNFGPYHKPMEVIIQGIYAAGNGNKPEEFLHVPVLTTDTGIRYNSLDSFLKYSALRIEKHGHLFRFLYSGGKRSDGAYKEMGQKIIDFQPGYLAIFALKGNGVNSPVLPVKFRKFMIQNESCD